MTKIIETKQGKCEIFPYDVGNIEPKGIQTLGFSLNQKQFNDLLAEMIKFKAKKFYN